MRFSRQEYWSGLPCPPPGDLPDPRIEPMSLMSPALAGGFLTTSTTWEALQILQGMEKPWRGGTGDHQAMSSLRQGLPCWLSSSLAHTAMDGIWISRGVGNIDQMSRRRFFNQSHIKIMSVMGVCLFSCTCRQDRSKPIFLGKLCAAMWSV